VPEKPAQTSHPLHDLLHRRWSPRAFAPTPIEPEKIGSLLEAVRWSASSSNEQPWRLILAQRSDPQAHQRMVDCLAPGNQTWAANAPLLILVCAATTFARDNSLNPHAAYDCGAAIAHLTTQALAMNLWVHQMAGFSPEKARTTFNIPADVQPLTVIAVGYYGDPATLPEFRQAQESAPRTRKPLTEIAFEGAWPTTDPAGP
jgi:nitroreductase